MAEIQHITEKTFRTAVENSDRPVLVDFYADWCAPCQMVRPELEKLACECEDITVASVNVDESNHLAERFGINSIPCMILFKGGEPIRTIVGFRSAQQLKALIGQ